MPPFAQVGGHASTITLSASDGSIINKPASACERAFYTQLGPSLAPGFVGEWTPEFYGVLTLQGKVGENGQVQDVDDDEVVEQAKEMLVLENITHRFLRPNVLDIKLGTQLYDEDASEEKKLRMDKAAKATTSAETGVRLTGFQVWDSVSQANVVTPKEFGKSIQVSDLPAGIARFFHPPSGADFIPSTSSLEHSVVTPAPLPLELLVPILSGILLRLEELEGVLSPLEIRIRGGSLLFVIEGDPIALADAVARVEASPPPVPTTNGDREDEEEDGTESVSTTDGEGNAKPATRLPWDLRIIDFAHVRAAPGEGGDEGLLKGIKTTRELIEGLRDRLEKEMEVISEA